MAALRSADEKIKVGRMSRKLNFVSAVVTAREIQVGDRLDMSGKTRVHATREYDDKVLVAHKTRGARSGSVNNYKATDNVRVYRSE
jgi:hypothetical protein